MRDRNPDTRTLRGWMTRLRDLLLGETPPRDRQLEPVLPAAQMPGLQHESDMRRRAARVLAPGEAFTPTQPKSGRRRLIGREVELRRILQALREDQAHVVLYAERGRGKTSLANLVIEALRRSGTIVARHTCDADTTYDDLMRGLMRDLPPALLGAPVTDRLPEQAMFLSEGGGCVSALPAGALRPSDILALPQRLTCKTLVCVIDEFDRVLDVATRTRLADTIKQLSDRGIPLLFMIVGVSDTLEQILGQHPSIQRSVIGVHLPLFSDEEVARLVVEGGLAAGLRFPDPAVDCVLWVSRGMPYMAQLMALRLAQAASARGDDIIVQADFEEAVDRLLAAAPSHIASSYAALTRYETDIEMVVALRHLASAPQDRFGRLRVQRAADGSATTAGYRFTPALWDELQASVLQEIGSGSELFAFRERGLMHHVLLLAARDVAQGVQPGVQPQADAINAGAGRMTGDDQ